MYSLYETLTYEVYSLYDIKWRKMNLALKEQ